MGEMMIERVEEKCVEKKEVLFFFLPRNKNGEFSNGFMSEFVIFNHKYSCVEQYKAAMKALVFKDYKIMNEILNSKDPKEMKRLGREIKGFYPEKWERVKRKVVKEGVKAKFSQNEEMRQRLLKTGKKVLAEANPEDRIWGIGFCKSHKDMMERRGEWGQNLLGEILMEVREELREEMNP